MSYFVTVGSLAILNAHQFINRESHKAKGKGAVDFLRERRIVVDKNYPLHGKEQLFLCRKLITCVVQQCGLFLQKSSREPIKSMWQSHDLQSVCRGTG